MSAAPDDPPWAFISYASGDESHGLRVQAYLKSFGIEAFLSENSIDPGDDWRDTLIKKLKQCKFFVLILTTNYHARYFTDQEFGMAVAMDKTIFVLRLDDTRPYGFMPHYQFVDERMAHLDPRQSNMIRMIKAISGVVGVRLELKKYLQDLIDSGSYRATSSAIEKIIEYDNFTAEALDMMETALSENSEVYEAISSKAIVRILRSSGRTW